MDFTDLQKNLRTYLENIPYDEKNKVRNDILALINENEGIPCVKTGVAKNFDDSYFCYIEATGFVAIGKQMHEIRILFPHNYPVAPPQFNIIYKPDQYKIQNEAALLASKVIIFEKTPANQVLINIKCPGLNACWSSEGRNAADAYRQVEIWLNNPPLLTPKERPRDYQRERRNQEYDLLRMSAASTCAERFVYDFQLRVFKIQEDIQKCEQGQTDVNFNLSRVEFFKRNLPKLQKIMKIFEDKVANKVNKLSEISEPISLKGTCDSLLEMGEGQKRKLQILGARQGLKEGQRKLTKAIQAEMRSKATKFSDYNNMIRKLSERMFEAQLNYLKMSD